MASDIDAALRRALAQQADELCEVAAGLADSEDLCQLHDILGQAACLVAVVRAVYLAEPDRGEVEP